MSLDSALALIESVKDYKVLVVGEHIVDEYHYVIPLGKAQKEHLIPVRYQDQEVFDGGVVAAANHLRSFCAKVDIHKNMRPIRKARMVERNDNASIMRKLFEIHYDDDGLHENGYFDDGYDVVAVADFGHGYITSDMIAKLCKMPFVAVSAQTNSSNIGFNLITKYPRADYIVIDEPEARLAAADRHGYIGNVMEKLSHGRCNKFVVTHGRNGAYGYQDGIFTHVKSMSEHVLDTMGAGDAFFAVTAPMAKIGDMDDLLLIGNAAGALKTQIVGHREPVTKPKLIEFLKTHARA